jgi:DNA-binding transcriptional LysR family regulator
MAAPRITDGARSHRSRRARYKDLRLSQLRSFCEVCERGGFAAAGEAMHLTTPAVWEQVRSIEQHYGVELLERDGRNVHPTPAGDLLFDMLRKVLAEFDSTHEIIQQFSGALPQRITLASSLRVQVHEILRAFRQFRAEYPTVGLRLRHVDSGDVSTLVLNGEADLGIMLKPGPDDQAASAIAYDAVTDLEFLLVMPPDHPLTRKSRLRIHDIAEYPLVLGRPEAFSRRRFEEVLHAHDLNAQIHVALETSSSSITLAAVREGLGIGVVACMPHGILMDGLMTYPLRRWFGTAQIVFVRRRGARLPTVHEHLADAIRESIVRGTDRDGKQAGNRAATRRAKRR